MADTGIDNKAFISDSEGTDTNKINDNINNISEIEIVIEEQRKSDGFISINETKTINANGICNITENNDDSIVVSDSNKNNVSLNLRTDINDDNKNKISDDLEIVLEEQNNSDVSINVKTIKANDFINSDTENNEIRNNVEGINDIIMHKSLLNSRNDRNNDNITNETTISDNVENEKIEDVNELNNNKHLDDDFDTIAQVDDSQETRTVSPEVKYRFKGPVFCSMRERGSKTSWDHSPKCREINCSDKLQETTPELNRSQYSLVSCGELPPGAVQLWLDLPEEVKYDEALAAFRKTYERDNGAKPSQRKTSQSKVRLPLVNSAPQINNNVHLVCEDVAFLNGKKEKDTDKKLELQEETKLHEKQSRFGQARHYIKMTMLLACWVFFTLVFLMYNEREENTRHSSVTPGEVKSFFINTSSNSLSVLVSLSGPFLTEQGEGKLNSSQTLARNSTKVWLERLDEDGGIAVERSQPWRIILHNDEDLDFNRGETRSQVLHLTPANVSRTNSSFVIKMKTTTQKITPFTMSYQLDPIDMNTGVVYASALLVGLYVLIIFEIINRTMAAILISTTALAALSVAGIRPSIEELVSWLDFETLLLLFSMMLLVAIMAETGIFDFLAVFTFEVTKGKLWPLITLLCAITAVLSTFLDNVTTVLLMTPVTIRLCEVMDLDPVPILMSMVLYSNIGGTATPVGDPPNVIIASNKAVQQAGVNFTNFTVHMTLGILLVCIQTYFQLRFMFRDTSALRQKVPRDIQELRHQISIWRRAADSLPHLSKDQHIVRERLERKVKKLSVQLEAMEKESSKRACPKDTFNSTLAELKSKYKIRDKTLLIKASVALSFVVIVFFLHSIPELNRVSLGWTALLGAILLLVLADREDLEPILHRVEWSTLLFFAALFVLMEALSKLGLIQFIGGLTEALIMSVDESARLAVALLLMLWVSGVSSAFVDNIPLTTMMVRIVTSLGSNPNINLPMAPLIWALSFGACLGGNGTLIGASANVVCAGVAEQHGYKFTFVQFFKLGFPLMIGHLIVASGYLLLCHCVFTWH